MISMFPVHGFVPFSIPSGYVFAVRVCHLPVPPGGLFETTKWCLTLYVGTFVTCSCCWHHWRIIFKCFNYLSWFLCLFYWSGVHKIYLNIQSLWAIHKVRHPIPSHPIPSFVPLVCTSPKTFEIWERPPPIMHTRIFYQMCRLFARHYRRHWCMVEFAFLFHQSRWFIILHCFYFLSYHFWSYD